MYIVIDDDKKIVAFHDEKRVVKRYVENYNKMNDSELSYMKVKKSYAKKYLKNKGDLYLVKYRSTYIQSGFYDSMKISETDTLEELENTKDVLYRILELDYKSLSEKEVKHIRSTINILEERITDECEYIPTMSEMRHIKDNIDRYRYEVY